LKAIAGDGKNLWAVGDVKQSIYRFRGASAYNMTRFDREDFPGGRRARLTTNYRSSEEIVQAFLGFASEIPSVKGSESGLRAHRGRANRTPEYRSVDTAPGEIAAVAEAIEEMRREGFTYRDQAILSSGNERLGRFAEGLERLGIPVLYLGNLFERDEVKELLALLSILVDRRAMGLVRVAAMDAFPIPLADVALLLAHLKAQDREPLHWADDLDSLSGLSAPGRAGLLRVRAVLDGFEPHANPWSVLCVLLFDRTRIAADLAREDGACSRSRSIAVWQFMNFLRAQPPGAGFPITRLLQRIRRLVIHGDERDLRQLPAGARGIDAVRLVTMHGSKGLEFSVVHIPGLNSGSLPRPASVSPSRIPPNGMIEGAEGTAASAMADSHAEEQECLFFVALSRARDRLFLYSPSKKSNGHRWSRSPFVDRIASHLVEKHACPANELPPSRDDANVQLTIEGRFVLSEHQLALYQRCPRRFFYTHILGVGGRRNETAFMQLHVAVQKLVDATSSVVGRGPSLEELEASLDSLWNSHGPADHGYSDDYRRIAVQLVRYYAELVSGVTSLPSPQLKIPVPGGEIVVTPHQVVNDEEGRIVMRQVSTGHKVSKTEESISAAAFTIAATDHSPLCLVELVYLSDSRRVPVTMTPLMLRNRRKSIEELTLQARSGSFPINESVACPRCPSFFICGPLPVGPIKKNFG
jgi:hypothetical protein